MLPPDSDAPTPAPRHKFFFGRWLGLFAVILSGVAVMALIGVGIRDYRAARKLGDCRTHLRQIGAALHAYHDQYGCFPPAYVVGADGARLHSWRVLLLPFLGQEDLYRQYKLDESWNSPDNRTLAAKIPEIYSCASTGGTDRGLTPYLAVVGRATAWPEQYCSRAQDFHDGTANTIQLVEWPSSDVIWIEPRDLTHQEAMKFDQPASDRIRSSAHQGGAAFLTLLGDGSVRSINTGISRDVFRSLLSMNSGAPLTGVDWPPDAIPVAGELPTPRPASDFRRTDVWPHPAAPIVGGRNNVYCGTFAIAWGAACDQLGGRPLQLAGDPPLAHALNQHVFLPSNLSDGSYVAAAGRGDSAFRDTLQAEVTRKFPKSAPGLINPDHRDHELQLYACLLKSLPFQVAFDAIATPLEFQTQRKRQAVASFGAISLRDDWRAEQLRSQVTILDYVSDEDLVLSVNPATPRDDIVLAKVAPATTLEATIAAVRRRVANPDSRHKDSHFLATESLAIPKLTLSVTREYFEIMRSVIGTDLSITGAKQIIKFRIDETGAVIESEAMIVADNGHTPHTPAGKRKFIFDRPYLIYLIEKEADQPYFAAWIENSELMEPIGQ